MEIVSWECVLEAGRDQRSVGRSLYCKIGKRVYSCGGEEPYRDEIEYSIGSERIKYNRGI